jgi:tRNA(adenine34) deaminase
LFFREIKGLERITLNHEFFMDEALAEARAAYEAGEIPIGAVVVQDGEIIARGHNTREVLHDATAHAEIVAIRQAGAVLGGWRLLDCTLYVTVEPCPMCAGAMIQARLPRLVYGARDEKGGAVGSLYNLVQDERFNHRLEVISGVRAAESAQLMQTFFRERR